jgi:uncharacterized lipoprotein
MALQPDRRHARLVFGNRQGGLQVGQESASTLDVPPDLTQLQKDNRYAVPDGRNGVATASGYQQQRGAAGPPPPSAAAGRRPGCRPDATCKVERAGNQRWLVIKQTPEQLWPQLKPFWPIPASRWMREELPTDRHHGNRLE